MNRTLAGLFMLLTLPLGLFLAGVVPLGQVADEPAHLLRADSVLHGALVGHRELTTLPDGRRLAVAGVPADVDLLGVVNSHMGGAAEEQRRPNLAAAWATTWNPAGPMFVQLGPISGYMPIFYLPDAAAIATAKLAGYGPYRAYLAARLANLVVYVIFGAAALLLARRGMALMFCALMVPMALDLAASAHQDGLLTAASVLAAALVTRASRPERPQDAVSRSPWFRAAAVLIGCVIVVKPPYFPLAAMLLLPLPPYGQWRAQRRELGRRVVAIVAIGLATTAWIWVNLHYASAPQVMDPYEAGPLFQGPRPAVFGGTDMAAQLSVLLARPMRLITLPVVQFWRDGFLLDNLVGSLGWLNVSLPRWLHTLWRTALVVAAVVELTRRRNPGETHGWLEAGLLVVAAFVALLGIYLSQYLVWTPVGVDRIDGPQGRYLLPLLPLLGLALPRLGVPGGRAIRVVLWLVPVAAAGVDLFMLPRIMVEFYYMHG